MFTWNTKGIRFRCLYSPALPSRPSPAIRTHAVRFRRTDRPHPMPQLSHPDRRLCRSRQRSAIPYREEKHCYHRVNSCSRILPFEVSLPSWWVLRVRPVARVSSDRYPPGTISVCILLGYSPMMIAVSGQRQCYQFLCCKNQNHSHCYLVRGNSRIPCLLRRQCLEPKP